MEHSVKGENISGHVLLNQCGSLLSRHDHRIVGYTSHLREWVNSKEWTKHYHNWDKLSSFEQEEAIKCFEQAAMQPMLRNWLATRSFLFDYIMKCPKSPFGKCGAFFGRDEYQSDKGNLPHIHCIMQIHQTIMDNKNIVNLY